MISRISVDDDLDRHRVPKAILAVAQFIEISFLSVVFALCLMAFLMGWIAIWTRSLLWPAAPNEVPPWFIWIGLGIPLTGAGILFVALAFFAARQERRWGLWLVLGPVALICIVAALLVAHALSPVDGLPYSMPFRLLELGVVAVAPGLAVLGSAWLLIATRATGGTGPAWPLLSIPLFAARYGALRPAILLAAAKSVLVFAGQSLLFLLSAAAIIALGTNAGLRIASFFGSGARFEEFNMIFECLISVALCIVIVALASLTGLLRRRGSRAGHLLFAGVSLVSIAACGVYLFHMIQEMARSRADPAAFPIPPIDFRDASFLLMFWLAIALRRFIARPIEGAGKRLMIAAAQTAEKLARARRERPILLLRSFLDDEQSVPATDALLRQAFGLRADRLRLEEITAQIMFARGPLVALQNPQVKARPLGAARDLASSDGWHELVADYVCRAEAVILFLGSTAGLAWEMDHILAAGREHDMIVVLPPEYLSARLLVRDMPQLAGLLGLKTETEERQAMSGARAVAYNRSAGVFDIFVSRSPSAAAYRTAIMLCAQLVFSDLDEPGWAGRRETVKQVDPPDNEAMNARGI